MQFNFGIGNLYAVRQDTTPLLTVPFGNIQDVQFDFSFEEKELYGQYQFPLDVARAKGKITGKAKFAHINTALFNNLFFGGTVATGETIVNSNFASSVPASTPYTVTITPPGSGTFGADLGVVYAATGIPFTLVASGPTVGQYSVAGAVYTFAAADASAAIYISYTYTVTTGNTLSYANQLMGAAPRFSIVWGNSYEQKNIYVKFNNCISTKFTLPMKLDDYTIPEFDFSAFADASGNIYTYSGAE